MHRPRTRLHILDGDEGDDPILSVVNIVDVFLVIIAVLLIAVMENPLNPFTAQNAIVIRNPGEADMEILIKKGEELKKYQSSGQIGEGEGVQAGRFHGIRAARSVTTPDVAPQPDFLASHVDRCARHHQGQTRSARIV